MDVLTVLLALLTVLVSFWIGRWKGRLEAAVAWEQYVTTQIRVAYMMGQEDEKRARGEKLHDPLKHEPHLRDGWRPAIK